MYGGLRRAGPDLEALRSSLRTLSVSAAAREVDLHLRQNREHVRDFFRLCFPALLRRIFGFEDVFNASAPSSAYSGGWLQQTSQPGYETDARALVSLLAPGGLLMQSLLVIDKEGLVKFTFPNERLPDWTRRLLATEQGVHALYEESPIFRGHILFEAPGRAQVQLNIFQYYTFWFAYYIICKDIAGMRNLRGDAPVSTPSSRPHLHHWSPLRNVSIPGLHPSTPTPAKPYSELLHLYLRHFLSFSSPLMQLPSEAGGSQGANGVSHADILLHSLVYFWLMDDDPAPFGPADQQLTQATATIFGQPASLTYAPAGDELLDSIYTLVLHIASNPNLANISIKASGSSTIDSGTPRGSPKGPFQLEGGVQRGGKVVPLMNMPGSLQALQRPFYRFLLRSFHGWPVNGPLTRVTSLVDTWLVLLEPWKLRASKPAGQSSMHLFGGESGQQQTPPPTYTSRYEAYVLANYPFYNTLLVKFLELACKALQVDCEAAVRSLVKLLSALERNPSLVDLLRSLEGAYSSYLAVQHPTTPFANVLPSLIEQLKDWDCGLEGPGVPNRNATGRGPKVPTSVPRLKLFSREPDAAPQLLQAMLLRLQAELQASIGGKTPVSPDLVRRLETLASKILTPSTPLLPPSAPPKAGSESTPKATSLVERFISSRAHKSTGSVNGTEEAPSKGPEGVVPQKGLRRGTWADVHYKGDWMLRPIQDSEVAFLVRFLVRLSENLNELLGLDSQEVSSARSAPATVSSGEADARRPEASGEGNREERPSSSDKQDIGPVQWSLQVTGRLLWRGLSGARLYACAHGWRLNLRFMAEKQSLVLMLVICTVIWLVRQVVHLVTSWTQA